MLFLPWYILIKKKNLKSLKKEHWCPKYLEGKKNQTHTQTTLSQFTLLISKQDTLIHRLKGSAYIFSR